MPVPENHEPTSDVRPLLAELLRLATRDGSAWRVPQDAVDRAYDSLVDRYLADSPPQNVEAWMRRVLWNHLKSGPRRAGLMRSRVRSLSGEETVKPGSKHEPLARSELRARLAAVWDSVVAVVTDAEMQALKALLSADSMSGAAEACGMSGWALRTRRSRIIEKTRRVVDRGSGTREEGTSGDSEPS